ncbi:MAG: tetratricopeptide repeat protein [Planctomycetia bacterium]|nr:tetratricopeptide repeat protein [Planctomycetia bacterium]
MKNVLVTVLVVAVAIAPRDVQAQHGRGGGGGGGGHRGGGIQGGGGHPVGPGGGGWNGGGPGRGSFQGGGHGPGAPSSHPANSFAHAGPRGPGPGHSFVYGHRPPYHGGWYHGDWHGYWGHPWAYRPWGWYWGGGWGFGWGFGTGLALGVTIGSPWGWGYYPYWNPYWVVPVGGVTYIDYSRPIVVAPVPVAQAPAPAGPSWAQTSTAPSGTPLPAPGITSSQQKALAIFDTARALFKQGNFQLALAETNRAIALAPNDTLVHEFRALCLFATKDYQQAAAAIYAVLSIGPGWDWATVSGLYSDPSVYAQQLRALQQYASENTQAPHARFLLAYHDLLQAHNEEAAAELAAVVQLQPNDQLSAQLLKGLTDPPRNQAATGPIPSSPAAPVAPVEAGAIVGNWTASRADGSHFELNIARDNKFTWKFTQQDKEQQLQGTYTLANNYLILSATDQQALVGQVAMAPGGKLQFKLAGGAPSDPGLTFTR